MSSPWDWTCMPYTPQLVTFFDILGFGNLIETERPAVIEAILAKLRRRSTPDKELRGISETSVIAFSDSVVRAVNILGESNVKHPSGILYYELFDLAFIQSLLVYEDGVFLRGAITADKLHFRGRTVFGPGLVRAYQLESKEAIYHRILVDDKLIELFKKAKRYLGARHHDLITDMEYIDRLAVVDGDGKRFVNYLGFAYNDIDGDLAFLDILDRHHERIVEKAKAFQATKVVMEKYKWVASYHNSIVNGYPDEFFEEFETAKEVYLVSDKELPGLSKWKIAK